MQHSANSESESKNYAIIFFGKLMQKVFPLEKWIEVGRCCHLNIFSLQSERGLKWDLEGLDAQTTEEVMWSNQRGHIKQLDLLARVKIQFWETENVPKHKTIRSPKPTKGSHIWSSLVQFQRFGVHQDRHIIVLILSRWWYTGGWLAIGIKLARNKFLSDKHIDYSWLC